MKKIYISICLMLFSAFAFSQFTKLFNFAGLLNGCNPTGDLFYDGTFLYGMTTRGGSNNMGVIFRIKPDGTEYLKLLDFAGTTNGSTPYGSLISDGVFLYGMTDRGGTSNCGVIFKIKPDGTGFSKLLDFTGTTTGSGTEGSLIFDGTFLYGMTYFGGTGGKGTVFKIKPDGTGYSTLLTFNGANGAQPVYATLISDGTFLYGNTYQGGTGPCTWGCGVVFKIKPDGSGYFKLLDFLGPNGEEPTGRLVSDETFLYGMTEMGGTNNKGILYKIKPDGTGYSKLLDFSGANGLYPVGSLIYDGNFLFGMTYAGGANNYGTIFKIKPDGTGYTIMMNFTGDTTDGYYPYGSLISDGTYFYGMTHHGGTYGGGIIFKYVIPTDIDEYSAEQDFIFHPNPSTSNITITIKGDLQKETIISIFNIRGEQIFSNAFNNKTSIDIDIHTLSKGVYLVKIQTEQGFAVKKLIIQ